MYPTFPDFDSRAAAIPTRYEPCSSAKTSPATFGAATDESSIIPKLISG